MAGNCNIETSLMGCWNNPTDAANRTGNRKNVESFKLFLKRQISDSSYSIYAKVMANKPINPSEAQMLITALKSVQDSPFSGDIQAIREQLSADVIKDYAEEGTGKTGGDRIWMKGFLFDDIKKGDILARPLIEGFFGFKGKIVNKLLPGGMGHTQVYGGFRNVNGTRGPTIINPYDDCTNGPIHIENFFFNMHHKEENKPPLDAYTIVRPSNNAKVNSSYVEAMIKDNHKLSCKFKVDVNCATITQHYFNEAAKILGSQAVIKNPMTLLNIYRLNTIDRAIIHLFVDGGVDQLRRENQRLNPFVGQELLSPPNSLSHWKPHKI